MAGLVLWLGQCMQTHLAQWRTKLGNHVRETSYDISRSRWEVSITCLDRSHLPCSWSYDGSQSQSPPWWCNPCTWIWGRGQRCSRAGYNVSGSCCVSPWMPYTNFKIYVLMIFLDHSVNEMACLPIVCLATQRESCIYQPRETASFLSGRPINMLFS
jgi:hypothetical protein